MNENSTINLIWNLISNNENFVHARYADGEVLLMRGTSVNKHTQAFVVDKWDAPDKLTLVGKELLETLNDPAEMVRNLDPNNVDLGRQILKGDGTNLTIDSTRDLQGVLNTLTRDRGIYSPGNDIEKIKQTKNTEAHLSATGLPRETEVP